MAMNDDRMQITKDTPHMRDAHDLRSSRFLVDALMLQAQPHHRHPDRLFMAQKCGVMHAPPQKSRALSSLARHQH
jgi:hypothetical protein